MANDLVVQLGAKLDQFQSDMNQAGDIADSAVDRIEQSFANLNPGLGGFSKLGLSITGITGSVGALLTALSGINSELAQIQKSAAFSNISTDRFQQIQFAAGQGGVDNKQSSTDLANVSKLLADAKYNENSLTKILDENNIKYKDRNGQIISLNQLLTIAGGLLGKFDSIPDKTKAAQMLGLSEGWVEVLRNSSKSFEAIASSADAAGAVIDAKTIAKAADFDRAWKASSAQLGAQFKSTLADIAGGLDGLIEKAQSFIESLNKANGVAAGSGQNKFDAYADALDIVRKDAQGTAQDVEQLTRVIDRMVASGSGDPQIIAGLELIRAKAELAAKMVQQVAEQQSKSEFPGGVPLPGSRPAAADTPTGSGKIPSRKTGSDARDQFDIAVDSITKRTATLKADTAAALENNVAQAQFRAEFQELTAIMRDNGEVTQEQIDKYEELRKTMSAQQALEASGITLTADHAQKFIDSSKAIGAATAGYDKAKKTLSDLNNASSQFGSALSTAFADAVVDVKNLGDVLSNLGKTLEKLAINSVFSSIFNAPASGGLSPFAGILKGIIPGFASGTDFAPGGTALVGENGPELVNLPRGSQVVPNDVARRYGGSGATTIQYNIDAAGADSGTVARIQTVLAQHARAIGAQGRAMTSSQRLQSTGVS